MRPPDAEAEERAQRAHVAATADERLEQAGRTLRRSKSEAEAGHDALADATCG